MAVLRAFGILLLWVAVGSLVWDVVRSWSYGVHVSDMGELWRQVSPGTLSWTRRAVERYALPELWDPVVVWVLLQPAPVVLASLGLLALLLSRGR